ncbi:MAG: DUF362 domain-containing protein [Fusicatenibacter sp.]|nr:DUF362 domain-containing protein [Lachnospiraceae bacterium]MDY2938559.1 DUF362 domain-containing protein [Fusicatenibacter sp.]
MKSKVAVIPCRGYDPEELVDKLGSGLSLIGGIDSILKPEEKIILKPNLVRTSAREKAVVTDPAVMEALIRILREQGCSHISCGDSCGFGTAEGTARESGLLDVLKRYDVPILDFHEPQKTDTKDGNSLMIARDVLNCDALISVSKMKTHALERITGAVKNQYGCISGIHKKLGHTQYPNAESFARMLIELNQIVSPRLYICDGITAMEGNGPTSGDPVDMDVLLISRDPIALDAVFCHLVYLDPTLVPTNLYGETLGLGTWREENLEILTPEGEMTVKELQKKYGNSRFRVDRKKNRTKGALDLLGVLDLFRKRPYIIEERCRKCGICVESCPVDQKAIRFENGRDHPPVYDYKKCIGCFCCQEMCPHQAISVKGHS